MPCFVAAILSDQLGRPIGIGQIWPERSAGTDHRADRPATGVPWSEEHIDRALQLLLDQEENGAGGNPRCGEPVSGLELVSLTVDWLTADTRLAPARSGGPELSADMIEVLVGRITRLRGLSAPHNSALIGRWVVHELHWARDLARNTSYDAPTGRRLYGAIAELAQLAGWTAEEKGHYAQGQQYLLVALHASGLAGDRNLGAYILSCLSYHLTKCGNGRDALRLIKLADIGIEDAVPGVLRSLQASLEAASLEACPRADSEEESRRMDTTDPDDDMVHLLVLEERIAAALLSRDDDTAPRPPVPPRPRTAPRAAASRAELTCCGGPAGVRGAARGD
ncbi:hypothetical protein [Streptomyces sp. AC602_WCS936]|uniref:hypothetical protein n=1 Tax=Streptomyces sp. AC602_WCS936 TaxID=2823685 RepID=UPI001C26E768|nr:hypothetical protein [Streptomyces sp. AC602_WCS936]